MSVSIQQSSFTGGEWTPELHSRTDLAKYPTATKKMRNFLPHPHGGASNRQGLDYAAATKHSGTKTSRLVPFQYSTVQSYIIEFGDIYVRFIRQGGQIVSQKVITGATNATPIVITAVAHGFATLNTVLVTGVGGNTAANGTWIITVTGVNTFELNGSVGNGAYTAGGQAEAIVEVATPYLEADLALLKFEQSADVLYITHPAYAVRKLTRTSHTAWTLSLFVVGPSISAPTGLAGSGAGRTWAVTAVTPDELESIPSATALSTVSFTLTWVAAAGADHYNVYEVLNGTYQFVGRSAVTSFALPASVVADPDAAAPKSRDPFSGAGNFPGCAAFFEQRLLLARTDNKPQTFNGSVTGDFQNHNISTPIKDDDAFEFTINSNQVNEIRWMAALTELIIGTSGSEWKLSSGSNSDALTPTSAQLVRQSRWGVAHLPPILIGNTLLFVDASSKKVRDLIFSLASDSYEGSNLTILAQHMFQTHSITEWSYAQNPDSIIWCVLASGNLAAMTYQKEHQVFGWHRHETDGLFESVATIQTAGGVSETYFIVKRTVNGAAVRYIEKLHERTFLDIEDAFFVDSGLTYNGSVAQTLTPGAGATVQNTAGVVFTAGAAAFVAGDVGRQIHYRFLDADLVYQTAKATITGFTSTTVVTATIVLEWPSLTLIASGGWRLSVVSLTGLTHLNGKTVAVLADGSVVSNKVVSAGSITLPNPSSKIHVGLGYTCDLQTLGFDYPTQNGTMQDKKRRINSLILRVLKTRAAWVGPDEDRLDELSFRDLEDYGEPTNLFSGDKEISIDPGGEREGSIYIQTREPLPCTVQAIIPRIDAGRS